MNVLYHLAAFPTYSQTFVTNEIRELRNRGHEVAVFAHSSEDDVPEDLSDIDYHVAPPRSLSGVLTLSPSHFDPRLLRRRFRSLSPLRQAYAFYYAILELEFVSSLPYDVDHVHGHFLSTPQIPPSLVAGALGVPHTVTAHAHDLYKFDHEPTRQHLYRHCDRIISISEYNRRFMTDEAAVDVDVDVIPAGFDADQYQPTDSHVPGRILTVARHVPKKGIRYAIEAVAALDDPAIEYHVASDGPLTPDLKALATDLGVSEQVEFLGRISDAQLRREYDEAHLFVLPCVVTEEGDRDGLPVAIKEAMAMQTPVVTTTVSGIPELVSDDCGYLVPPRDVDALAEALSAGLSSDPAPFGARARERVGAHDVEETTAQLLRSISELQDAPASQRREADEVTPRQQR
ncbi:glycosyltransferase [Haloarchaeobius sp. HRN-SO-5]|uniref:glycosyltransferase n=1 Tax=Haloarchaeobius sp. HRN-SO-5 TaxID=3446118 RepID=UPI003EBFDA0F